MSLESRAKSVNNILEEIMSNFNENDVILLKNGKIVEIHDDFSINITENFKDWYDELYYFNNDPDGDSTIIQQLYDGEIPVLKTIVSDDFIEYYNNDSKFDDVAGSIIIK